jgi:hypothetical protein
MRALTRRAVTLGGAASCAVPASSAVGAERFSTKAMRQNAAVREVDTLLVLATDVSNSVVKERWDVQRNGYARRWRTRRSRRRFFPARAAPSACASSNGRPTISKRM